MRAFVQCAPLLGLLCISSTVQSAEPVSEKGNQALSANARGLVRARNRVEIGTDLVAPIARVPFREGQAFKMGDVLIAFECRRYEAEHNAARASAHAANLELKQKNELRRYGAAGKGQVELAQAGAAKAQAETSAIAARLEGCTIDAPFDGRVASLSVAPAELPPSGKPLMTILDDHTLEIEFVAPSHWLRWIDTGQPFQFTVDETGETLSASIERVAAEVDPVSQTIRVIGRIEGEKGRTLAGMSGTVRFPSESTGAVSR